MIGLEYSVFLMEFSFKTSIDLIFFDRA